MEPLQYEFGNAIVLPIKSPTIRCIPLLFTTFRFVSLLPPYLVTVHPLHFIGVRKGELPVHHHHHRSRRPVCTLCPGRIALVGVHGLSLLPVPQPRCDSGPFKTELKFEASRRVPARDRNKFQL